MRSDMAGSTLPVPTATDFVTVARADPHTKPADIAAVSVSADGRYIAFVGHHGGTTPSFPDSNGTSIVDVTDPAHPVYLIRRKGV